MENLIKIVIQDPDAGKSLPQGVPGKPPPVPTAGATPPGTPTGTAPPVPPPPAQPTTTAKPPPSPEMIDVRKTIEEFGGETDKAFEAFEAIRKRMADHIAAGGKVSQWMDGKEVPIAKVEGGKSYGADGLPQGMMPLAMGLPGAKTGVELYPSPAKPEPPAVPPPVTQQVPAQAPTGTPQTTAAPPPVPVPPATATQTTTAPVPPAPTATTQTTATTATPTTSTVAAFDRPQPVVVMGPKPLPVAIVGGNGGGDVSKPEPKPDPEPTGSRFARVLTTAANVTGQVASGAGQIVGAAAAGNNAAALGRAADAASAGLSKLGPHGMAAAAGLQAVSQTAGAASSVMKAFADRGRELSQYSGATASAAARAEVNQMRADMREAQVLGERMAKMIEKEDQLDRTIRELLLPIKEFLLDKLLEFMNDGIDFMKVFLKFADDFKVIFKWAGGLGGWAAGEWASDLLKTLKRIEGEGKDPLDFLDNWLEAGRKHGLDRGRDEPNLPPLFDGFNFNQFQR